MLQERLDPGCPPTSPRSDDELLLSYAENGGQGAFEELVHRYERRLFSFLRNYLGDTQLAEDAFQATFLKVHLFCRQFQPGRKVAPWLYRIALNQATDLLRRSRRHKALSLDRARCGGGRGKREATLLDYLKGTVEEPGQRVKAAEDRQRVEQALKELPDGPRQLINLVLFQGLKYREAAEALGIPVGTVKSQMHEAVRRLHKQIIAPAASAQTLCCGCTSDRPGV